MQANANEGKEFFAVLFTRREGVCSDFTSACKLEAQSDKRGQILGLSSFAEAEELFGGNGMMIDPQGHLNGGGSWTWRAYRRGLSLYELPALKKPDTLVAFCSGNAINPKQYDCHAVFACIFPQNRSWDVVEKVKGPSLTFKRAGYLALLEVVTRGNLEDPKHVETLVVYSENVSVVDAEMGHQPDVRRLGHLEREPCKKSGLAASAAGGSWEPSCCPFRWINVAASTAKSTAQAAASSATSAVPWARICQMPALSLSGDPTNIARYDVLQKPGEEDVMDGEEDAAAA
ncbi:hypothetical protein ON010_g1240 [Phytophthora cinnamomi]|nr:hypothetical protein ON010_g1240 [Phytophthora cinnamomi]